MLRWLPLVRLQLEWRKGSETEEQERRSLRWLLWPPIGVLGLGSVVLLLWAVVVVPPQLIDVSRISNAGDQAKAVSDLRSTLAAVLAGLAVGAGAIVGALNFRETGRQNRAVLELQRRGQVTDRFTRAIEQLGQRGDEKLDVRIGAVYALEQIARDSAEMHWPVVEVLTAFVRHRAPKAAFSESRAIAATGAEDDESARPIAIGMPEPDIQAILTVIGRRDVDRDAGKVSLLGVNLDGAELEGADLRNANLQRTSLRAARLQGANLNRVSFYGADLRGTYIHRANMQRADLRYANMQGVWANRTDFRGALFWGANLSDADLHLADLREADLSRKATIGVSPPGANYTATHWQGPYPEGWTTTEHYFPPVKLAGAVLLGAQLQGADFRGAEGLTAEQLGAAAEVGDAALPDSLLESLNRMEVETGPASQVPGNRSALRHGADAD